jgi:hypothetical protein
MLIRHGWTVVQLSARRFFFFCESCEAINADTRAKIERLLEVSK